MLNSNDNNNNQNNQKNNGASNNNTKKNDFEETDYLIKVLGDVKKELENQKKEEIKIIYRRHSGKQYIRKSHIKEGINDFLLKFMFFFIAPLFGILFLIGIFQMKSIMNALGDLIKDSSIKFYKCNFNSNCNITIIDDKSSVYDFYNYFYYYTKNETINFNLMMITAFLGGLLLRWKGFRVTTCLLCIPTVGATIWLLEFNFDFKIDGVFDYDILKIFNLIFIYFLFLVGLGGSALLSQQILIEGHLRYKSYLIKKIQDSNKTKEEEEKKKRKQV